MFWFNGSIRNAVDKVKSSGVFLLVFVQGDDDLSKKYEIYLNEESKFKLDEYVAIRIPHGSVALQQFKQIYVSVPIPSVFLIQNNGIPLKVISSDDVSDIQSAISETISKKRVKQEKKEMAKLNKGLLSDISKKSADEKTSRPLQHIKNIGHKITDVSEDEIRKRLMEIRAFPKFLLIDSPLSINSSSYSISSSSTSARIQFRLPNNTMPSWEFPDLSTLGDVRAYLIEKMNLSLDFKLLRSYPRSSFTPQDELKTLIDLGLTPSATLIVVPVQHKTVQAKVKSLIAHQSFFSSLLNTLLRPLFLVFNYFKNQFFPRKAEVGTETPMRLPSETAVERIFNKKTSTTNIHGFKFDDDTDTDTEHPDNGNSTQQRFQK